MTAAVRDAATLFDAAAAADQEPLFDASAAASAVDALPAALRRLVSPDVWSTSATPRLIAMSLRMDAMVTPTGIWLLLLPTLWAHRRTGLMVTDGELAVCVDCSARQIRRHIATLAADGRLVRIGSGRRRRLLPGPAVELAGGPNPDAQRPSSAPNPDAERPSSAPNPDAQRPPLQRSLTERSERDVRCEGCDRLPGAGFDPRFRRCAACHAAAGSPAGTPPEPSEPPPAADCPACGQPAGHGELAAWGMCSRCSRAAAQ